ncbi:hypothetical protein [Pseudoduganella lutea]|uniref:PEP-CTERM sorting domain-containing protein n=1 Tax=Pseudoduganella lutea TaxID=321985 RepID=A0A4P6KZE0_9BURK|nr:hypothetical protein [Pseudoduganella lutea]QBE64621.1 hypothetical protein EWM63_17840 [Pseudoduganella lutea]
MRIVLPLLAAALSAAPVQAQTLPSLSVPTFSLQYVESMTWAGEPLDAAISVESTDEQVTVLRLDGTAERLATVVSESSYSQIVSDQSRIRFAVAEGYRITKIEFSGMLSGELVPAEVPAGATMVSQPLPRNQMLVTGTYFEPDSNDSAGSYWTMETDIESAQGIVADIDNSLNLPVFDWHLGLYAIAHGAESSYYLPGDDDPELYFIPAAAYLHLSDPRLTIHTEAWTPSPVPEPGQWAMLASGLMLLGTLGWRGRAARARLAIRRR